MIDHFIKVITDTGETQHIRMDHIRVVEDPEYRERGCRVRAAMHATPLYLRDSKKSVIKRLNKYHEQLLQANKSENNSNQ